MCISYDVVLCTINVVGIYLCMPYVALCTINGVGMTLCTINMGGICGHTI